jgi:hypothetical protein
VDEKWIRSSRTVFFGKVNSSDHVFTPHSPDRISILSTQSSILI